MCKCLFVTVISQQYIFYYQKFQLKLPSFDRISSNKVKVTAEVSNLYNILKVRERCYLAGLNGSYHV